VVRRINREELPFTGAGQSQVRVTYRVEGLKCEACGNGLKRALEGVGGVKAAIVRFDDGMVQIEGKGDRGLPVTSIEEVIDSKGLKAQLISDSLSE
jgi:copper chaperone CopZ